MGRQWGFGPVVAAGAAVLVLSGCSAPTDYSEIVTFTDEHGRVCTATVVVDQEQAEGDDHEVTSLDCDYPPQGETPGPSRYRPMPDRGSN